MKAPSKAVGGAWWWGMAVLLLSLSAISCAHPVLKLAADMPFIDGGYTPPTTATLQEPLALLEKRVEALGITVEVMPESDAADGYFGYASSEAKMIWLPETLSVDARFEVLAHEAAHHFQPPVLNKSESEVFAELVAYEVARYYGHNTRKTSGSYLSGYKGGISAAKAFMVDVKLVTQLLTGQLDTWQ